MGLIFFNYFNSFLFSSFNIEMAAFFSDISFVYLFCYYFSNSIYLFNWLFYALIGLISLSQLGHPCLIPNIFPLLSSLYYFITDSIFSLQGLDEYWGINVAPKSFLVFLLKCFYLGPPALLLWETMERYLLDI